MSLTTNQLTKTDQVWDFYNQNGEKITNAKREYSNKEINSKRLEVIPLIMEMINDFYNDKISLELFKSQVDGINKRNRLWGFMAINGQMFFNMVTKTSQNGGVTDDCTKMLQEVIRPPKGAEEIRKTIKKFETFVIGLGKYCEDPRAAPRAGSIPFFLSYFWQIQKPDEFPVYYTSMVQALQDLDIWSPSKNIVEDYVEFYTLNHELLDYLEKKTGKELSLWEVEHAFWVHYLTMTDETIEKPDKGKKKDGKNKPGSSNLPESYLPPIVSILPRLANNDPELAKICKDNGKAIEKEFEERLAVLFGMLGFETVLLGQGKGRVPDGIAISDEFRYGIIYDAKVREQGYVIGTDERAIREYITNQAPRLRNRGINTLYFLIISSSFVGNPDNTIRSIKIETRINEVILVEVKALLTMLEAKLRNPTLNLGPFGLQRLFASSGVLSNQEVADLLEA